MRKESIEKITEGFVKERVPDCRGGVRNCYIYRGDYYSVQIKGLSAAQIKGGTLFLAVAGFIVLLCALFCKNDLNIVAWAGGFAFLAMIPVNFVVIGSLRFVVIFDKMRIQQVRECQKSICLGAACASVLLLLAALGDSLWMMRHTVQLTRTHILLTIIHGGLCAIFVGLAWIHQRGHYVLRMEGEEA